MTPFECCHYYFSPSQLNEQQTVVCGLLQHINNDRGDCVDVMPDLLSSACLAYPSDPSKKHVLESILRILKDGEIKSHNS